MPLIGAEASILAFSVSNINSIDVPLIGVEAFIFEFSVQTPLVISPPLIGNDIQVFNFSVSGGEVTLNNLAYVGVYNRGG